MKRMVLLLVTALHTVFLAAQHTETKAAPVDTAGSKSRVSNLLEAFQQGRFHGHFRTYFMATDNTRQLSDYYAWAAGGGLHFSTAPWHGFSFGIGGIFNYNLASSDLAARDSLTGALNRYEIGLFDVENPRNRDDLDRIEELWLRYAWKKSRVTLGQQSIQTPFVNYQDGRMRPTAESGIWLETNALKNSKIEGGWLWKISPRSTVKWYGIGESIGLYPKGLNPDGTVSGYPENLESKGIGIMGITRQLGKHGKVQVWNHYVENIFNTAFIQADYKKPLKSGHELLFSAQFTHQNALAEGGNSEESMTYFTKGGVSNVFSTRVGWERKGWQAALAYTRTTGDGRFLFPREWGREPFFTFMPRERIEGNGDVHAFAGRAGWQTKNGKLHLETAYGHFYLPDVKNAALSKYAFPSFNQFNFDVRYTFGGVLEGLRAQLLYVWKGRLGEVYGSDRYVINKVDMSHINLILNYTY